MPSLLRSDEWKKGAESNLQERVIQSGLDAITGVDANYSLASDGTATVVTVASTDPEGFPLTFSHAVTTGSLGSTATVAQGTGANTNVFTITPSTDAANAGTFSLTFSVTDGATGAVNSIGAFTLAFEMSGALAYTLASPTPTVGSYFGHGVAVNDTYTAISLPGIYNAGPGEIKVYNNSNGTLARTISNYDGPSNGNMGHYGSLCCSATYVCAMSNNARFQIFNMSTGAHVRSIQATAGDNYGGGDGSGMRMAMTDTYLLLGANSADYGGTNVGLAKLYRISDGVLMYTWTYAPSGATSRFGTAVAINATQAAVTYNRGYMSNPYGGVNGVRIFNLGTGNPNSINHLVKILGGKRVYIPKRPGEPNITCANPKKIQKMLKWKPKVKFEKGVKIMITDIKKWKNAPLWNPNSIKKATKSWFSYMRNIK